MAVIRIARSPLNPGRGVRLPGAAGAIMKSSVVTPPPVVAATGFKVVVTPVNIMINQLANVAVVALPVGSTWPASASAALTRVGLTGVFSRTTVPLSGTASGTATFQGTLDGTGTINATVGALTNQSVLAERTLTVAVATGGGGGTNQPLPPSSIAAYTGSGGAESFLFPMYSDPGPYPDVINVGLMSHGANDPTPMHTSRPGFARGHLPANKHLAVTAGGQVVPIQQDGESLWSDDTVRTSIVTWPAAALTAGVESVAQVQVLPGAPDRTPFITPQALVALVPNLEFRAFGLECAGVTYTTNIKQIVDTKSRDVWGVNPLGGWDVPMSGPYKVMLRVWQYRRSGNAHHRWIRDTAYLSYDTLGNIETAMRTEMPNWDIAVPGGTLGDVVQHRCAHYVELWNAGARAYVWGGPDDPRVITAPMSAFLADGKFDPAVLNSAKLGFFEGATFEPTAGSTLPSGIQANTPYWFGENNYGTERVVQTRRNDERYDIVAPGTPGTGTVRIIPFVFVSYGSGPVMAGQDGLPIRLNGPRVATTVRWDETYMSRHAKLWPSYHQDMVRPPSQGPGKAYFPGQAPWGLWLNGTGNDPFDNRIGYVTQISLQALLRPHDAAFVQAARQEGIAWSDQPLWYRNPRTGRLIVSDNGPNDAGATYPQLGANMPIATYQGNGAGWLGAAGGGTGNDFGGYRDGYSAAPIEGSHCPCPWAVPAFLTGHPIYSDMGAMTANAVNLYKPETRTVGGRTFYNVIGLAQQPRGAGWNLRQWSYAEAFTAFGDPERAYVSHTLDTLADWGAAQAATSFVGKSIGLIEPRKDFSQDVSGYMHNFYALALYAEVWRGDRPNMRPYAAVQANFTLGIAADARADGGTGWLIDRGYGSPAINAQGSVYVTHRARFADQAEFGNSVPPFPATGFIDAGYFSAPSSALSPVKSFGIIALNAVAMAATAGLVSERGDDGVAVYNALATRFNTAGAGGCRFSTATQMSPTTAIVP